LDEPRIYPQPLSTLHVRTPTLTPAACAGASHALAAITATPTVSPSLFDICRLLWQSRAHATSCVSQFQWRQRTRRGQVPDAARPVRHSAEFSRDFRQITS